MSAALSFAPLLVQVGTPIKLAMQRLWLGGRVLPAGARLTVQHVFRSAEDKPLEIIYAFPLPRDAALRGFRITGDGFEAHSELRPVEEAIRAYEKGIAEGSLAALAREHGDGVVNLTVGNIRPKETVTVYLEILAGVELRDDGFRFRFPFTLAPAYHKQMRSSSEGDEGEIELPSDQFGDVILPPIRKDASNLHEVGFELSMALGLPADEIASPSHNIRVRRDPIAVSLAPERDVPDRDLVLDVRYTKADAQVLAGPAADGKRSFAAIVPSTMFGEKPSGPRRTVILLDRSGSMQGSPIAQARKAIDACLAVLAENDSFGLVAFDDKIETLDSRMLSGSRENRDRARQFLGHVDARGGTDLATGVEAAARMLGEGGDILVLTDGQVAGTEQILAQARATGVRLFCLGIGSASQDRFLTLLSRETGGVSRFVTPRERVDLSAVDLFASMSRPVASGLQAAPEVQPEAPKSVFAGTPVLLLGETANQNIDVTWDRGQTSMPIPAGDQETGDAVRLLRGSRLITDWESRYPSQEALAPIEKRRQNRIAAQLVEWSTTYGLASREMALVAVVKRAGDRPGELPETRVVPVGMPQDTAFNAYFPQPAGAPAMMAQMFAAALPPSATMGLPASGVKFASLRRMFAGKAAPEPVACIPMQEEEGASEDGDDLMNLAAQLQPDGGMPGKDVSDRVAKTIAALREFLAHGHSIHSGAFRGHVQRLVEYLESVRGLSAQEQERVRGAIQEAHK